MDSREWISDLIGSDSIRAAAMKIGVSHSTIHRQLERGGLQPGTAIDLCRAYGRNPADGLVELGFINRYELLRAETPLRVALETATNRQILEELLRRSDPEAREMFGSTNGLVGIAADAEPLPPRGQPHPNNSSTSGESDRASDYDHDAIIAKINAGEIKIAAQEATEPLEEHQP